MRRKLIEADVIECVLGLGPNLFYNSPMEACVVICRTAKPKQRRNKILFINAVNEVTRERAQSFLTDAHIERIVKAYEKFKDEPGFTRVVGLEEIHAKDGSLSLPLYVSAPSETAKMIESSNGTSLAAALDNWLTSRKSVAEALRGILPDICAPTFNARLNGLGTCVLFDRSNWQRVRFGDVVENLNETEHNPEEAGIERFIGLEHLEPGSLHIREWGNVADGTTFTRRCRPGQVLFGKRRAYQRKVAVAEFDAVVSGDIYVFAPKNDRLLPELLPFLCLSERFFNFAVETSAGSLSPRTNWSHLAQFEFALPPLDQQHRIAEILWVVDEVIAKTSTVVTAASAVVEAELDHFLYHSSRWAISEARDLLAESPRNGFSPPGSANDGRLPTLSISAIRGGIVVPRGSLKYADVRSDEVAQFYLRRNDILVVRGNGNRQLCGRAGIVRDFPEGCFYPDLLIRLRFRADCLLPEFAVMQWNEPKTHARLLQKAKSTNGIWKVNGQDVSSHWLAAPPCRSKSAFLYV